MPFADKCMAASHRYGLSQHFPHLPDCRSVVFEDFKPRNFPPGCGKVGKLELLKTVPPITHLYLLTLPTRHTHTVKQNNGDNSSRFWAWTTYQEKQKICAHAHCLLSTKGFGFSLKYSSMSKKLSPRTVAILWIISTNFGSNQMRGFFHVKRPQEKTTNSPRTIWTNNRGLLNLELFTYEIWLNALSMW